MFKSLLDRDQTKIEKARNNLKESLLLMKKHYEKTDEYLQECMREDEEYTKFLMETYPELRVLEDVKIAGLGSEEQSRSSMQDLNALTVTNTLPN